MGFLQFLFILLLFIAGFVLCVAFFFSDEVKSTREKDPAATSYLHVILLYSGLHAIVIYRVASWLWKMKLLLLARALSQFGRFLTGIEIHPGARIGKGLFIDHGTGVVIGETAIIGDHVTLFQGVTLGGTGKECGKRHPTIADNVVVGAGAKILGNINIGAHSYIGANAVVLRDVPSNATVVGVPGHITRQDGRKVDGMDHLSHSSDPLMQHMKELIKRIKTLEDQLKNSKSTKNNPDSRS
jgi:serine O-acetyltransferase